MHSSLLVVVDTPVADILLVVVRRMVLVEACRGNCFVRRVCCSVGDVLLGVLLVRRWWFRRRVVRRRACRICLTSCEYARSGGKVWEGDGFVSDLRS